MDTIKWVFFDLGSTLIDESACYAKRFQETTEGTGVCLQLFLKKISQLAADYDEPYRETIRVFGLQKTAWHSELETPYPFTAQVLRALSQKYQLGILANQPKGTKQRLNAWGIGRFFNLILSSAEEGFEKPDQSFFHLALSRAGCLPQEAVMVGDRLDNDMLPAKSIGMKTVWVRQGFAKSRPLSDLPDCTVNTLPELLQFL